MFGINLFGNNSCSKMQNPGSRYKKREQTLQDEFIETNRSGYVLGIGTEEMLNFKSITGEVVALLVDIDTPITVPQTSNETVIQVSGDYQDGGKIVVHENNLYYTYVSADYNDKLVGYLELDNRINYIKYNEKDSVIFSDGNQRDYTGIVKELSNRAKTNSLNIKVTNPYIRLVDMNSGESSELLPTIIKNVNGIKIQVTDLWYILGVIVSDSNNGYNVNINEIFKYLGSISERQEFKDFSKFSLEILIRAAIYSLRQKGSKLVYLNTPEDYLTALYKIVGLGYNPFKEQYTDKMRFRQYAKDERDGVSWGWGEGVKYL